METTQTSTIVSGETRSGWRKTDTMWMLGLYGTAIGAGVLFLPINAGGGRHCAPRRRRTYPAVFSPLPICQMKVGASPFTSQFPILRAL